MLAILLHFLVGLLGLALLYSALFLHENEEGQLRKRLEKLWIDIDDLSKAALSKQAAFLQRVSAMANSALNKLFGARLFSAGAVAASLCFSMGSLFLLALIYAQLLHYKESSEIQLLMLAFGVFSFLLGLLPTPWRYVGFLWILSLIASIVLAYRYNPAPVKEESLAALGVPVGGLVSDVLFIALSRWCLRKGSELRNRWKIAALVALNGCFGLVLISPVVLAVLRYLHLIKLEFQASIALMSWTAVGFSNGVTGAISLLFVLLAVVALLHLLIWPLLERPLYSLQRFGVARNSKLLASVSVTCLLFAWPHSPLILGITKLLHLD